MKMTKRIAAMAMCGIMAITSIVSMSASAVDVNTDNNTLMSELTLAQSGDTGYTMSVPLLYQSNSSWGSTVIGTRSDGTTATIKSDGCAITCFAMILRYHGLTSATPKTVYDKMKGSAFPAFDFYGAANTYYKNYVSLKYPKTTYIRNTTPDDCDNLSYKSLFSIFTLSIKRSII